MNELSRNNAVKANYFALFIAITKNISAKNALIAFGISPDNVNKEVYTND